MWAFLRRYIQENWDDLLALDLKLARILGAPAPHTLSSYAYELDQKKSKWGHRWRVIIDYLALQIFHDLEHCRGAYDQYKAKLS